MFRTLLLVSAAALVACVTPQPPQPTPAPAFVLTADMSCNATQSIRCPANGCAPGVAGEPSELPISIHVPRNGGAGRFCFATGCEDAVIEVTPQRGSGWAAIVHTDERTNKDAELTIARDLTFTLRDADDMGVATWSGVCQPSGS